VKHTSSRAVAIVGVSAILPDAPDAKTFWENIKGGRYSISDVPKERWDPDLYYDPDPKAPDKSYSRIGGWVREWEWEPYQWHLPIPPKISDAMDDSQKWAVALAQAALNDYGDAERPLDRERTAVILGTAMGGERHYLTTLRIFFPEFARALAGAPSYLALPEDVRTEIQREMLDRVREQIPAATEDTMPGELANCMAGRVANLFNFNGPNYICDAACASALAAIDASVEGLVEHEYDAVLTGGIDRNMGISSFVKFCKIGALSATGTRPYADGADGFVMGEGAAMFLLKRLEDAEANGDRIYAVLRGVGGSSDGRGKGITAPNPSGQRFALRRAWENAGLSPATVGLIEGHGTSTRVGDVVEVESLNAVFGGNGLAPGSVALGSVKSNIGHLKSGAGAAGLLKATLALHEKVLPPSLNCDQPNPNIDFSSSPFYVNTQLQPWEQPSEGDGVRRAGVSAFGFGGTNFHVVLEEYIPGRLKPQRETVNVVNTVRTAGDSAPVISAAGRTGPLQGALVLGAPSMAELQRRLLDFAATGRVPPTGIPPAAADLASDHRIAISYADAKELQVRLGRAEQAFKADQPPVWKALQSQGIFYGRGPRPKIAFLYTGQGSQYANMLADLRKREPVVAETFDEADRVMGDLIGRRLSDIVFVDPDDATALERAEQALRRTEITQPAVLTVDTALTRLYAANGIEPDLVMGHSLGEYGALVASGALPFDQALEAVSARVREMVNVSMDDNGLMAAVFAPLEQIQQVVDETEGNVVIANINSNSQAVIGGASDAVTRAVRAFEKAGVNVAMLPVSHAFHTSIVAPASEPLRQVLERMTLQPPRIPLVANVTGELYPTGPGAEREMLELLSRQVASPVQFVKGLNTLFEAGARVFVEVGPKKALQGFADDVLGTREGVMALSSNHPKVGDIASFNQALCGLYAAGLGAVPGMTSPRVAAPISAPGATATGAAATGAATKRVASGIAEEPSQQGSDRYRQLGQMFAGFLEQAWQVYRGGEVALEAFKPTVVTGAALGLPGTKQIFDDANVQRILDGEQEIDVIPTRFRHAIVDKNITRLVKSGDGDPHFETINSLADVIKLAGRGGEIDLERDFGVPAERIPALDITTRLAMAAGIDALRDAGIPLIMHYRTTRKGTRLPERWMLPEAMRDDTGVIFAAAFPGYDAFADELTRYQEEHGRRAQLESLCSLRERLQTISDASDVSKAEVNRRIHELEQLLEREPYEFDRRFLFKCLAMGHSQMAEYIGARGPNTHVNAACASTTQAFAVAEDWIRTSRCRRVLVIAADDVTSDHLLEWVGAGFLASGAAATDEVVEEAALPFDRRRHGMILGMGACGIVIESREAAAERGIRPICEVLSTVTANSAFHGTRLDIDHICEVMEQVVSQAEQRFGIDRREIAPQTMFMSHETYTPARGGSASAEVHALRRTFGEAADQIVVANTKGLTGHAMGVGIEDTVAIKALETGVVPPVANFREQDPDLGSLNLSRGGVYPVRYALRLGAGFGSQISLSLMRWVPSADGSRPSPDALGYLSRLEDPSAWRTWLKAVSGSAAPELEVVQRTLRVSEGSMGVAEPEAPPVEPAVSESGSVTVAPSPSPAPHPETAAPIETTSEAPADPVAEKVLAIVAEITGYPTDMLELDLDLEADLGIDTVKQAETFAAVRGEYDIPRDENLKLRDYPTIAHAIQFVRERRPDLAATAVPAAPATDTVAAEGAAEAAPAADDVTAKVLAIVAEITGYPQDMLDLDLDLEADLGIDTVKQAETFAAIREHYDIPRDENLKLRDYPSIAHAIQFVHERAPVAVSAITGAAEAGEPDRTAVSVTPKGNLAAAAAVPRRVPRVVLRPDLELCKPTGVELGDSSRVVLMPDQGGVGKALTGRLEKLGVTVLTLGEDLDQKQVEAQLEQWVGEGPIDGVYWLPALDRETALVEMDPGSWRAALELRAKLLYTTMRTLYDQIESPGTFLVSATRLGGLHGYGENPPVAPMGGAVTGFTKAYSRERPLALVKAVDFEESRRTAALADRLLEETRLDPGVVEVGIHGDRRWCVTVVEQPAENGEPGMSLDDSTVFAVTGAAGSIVSAITADLAEHSGGIFYLLDRVQEPDRDNDEIRRVINDRDGLKRDIFERLKSGGERVTPAMVERNLAELERANAALAAIEAVEAAGGIAHYRQVNLTDSDAVAAVVDDIRTAHGRIDVLLHAAGIERSHILPDKPGDEFDLVMDVKCDGWFNLLRAIGDMPLGATVAFSSIAGRFGNLGQTDYSAANDLLCKMSLSMPGTRGIAIDWTAWADIGMASRGGIPAMMAQAGIDMLPPEAGIPVIRRELTAGSRRGEVLIAGNLGVLMDERDPQGGADTAALSRRIQGPMLGEVVAAGVYGGLQVRTLLDPGEQPFLHDHQIDGTPVLPGVMAMEAFAEMAALVQPDLSVRQLENVELQAPFKFYRGEPRTLYLYAQFERDGDELLAHCRCDSRRKLHGKDEEQVTTHFLATVRLGADPLDLGVAETPSASAGPTLCADDLYRVYFHGPAYQVLTESWLDQGRILGRMNPDLPANHQPITCRLTTAPRLVELCFQTAGSWDIGTKGKMALPRKIDQVRFNGAALEEDQVLHAVVTPRGESGQFDATVVDQQGRVLVELKGYESIEYPGAIDEFLHAPFRTIMAGE
jgi:malonyl CoA-acyl carrier protein transacylase